MSGQSEPGAQNPARGGRGPSTPNGPNGPLRGSESAKVGAPLPHGQAQEALREARCLPHLDLRIGGL
eukprot:6263858-Alexandrium_andersonii.AAC.1